MKQHFVLSAEGIDFLLERRTSFKTNPLTNHKPANKLKNFC